MPDKAGNFKGISVPRLWPGHPDYVRQWEAEDSYVVTGRGLVYAGREPDPPFQLGEWVEINDSVSRVFGLERHPINGGPIPGRPVGVLTEENRERE